MTQFKSSDRVAHDRVRTSREHSAGPMVAGDQIGRNLDALEGRSVKVLHALTVPGTRMRIEHVVVTSSGVHVVVTGRYRGSAARSVGGGLLRSASECLIVDGRNRDQLVKRALRQRELVCAAIDDISVPVRAVVCLPHIHWASNAPLFVRGVEVVSAERLIAQLGSDGVMSDERIATIHHRIRQAFLLI